MRPFKTLSKLIIINFIFILIQHPLRISLSASPPREIIFLSEMKKKGVILDDLIGSALYIVKKGDTLYSISNTFGIEIHKLAYVNNINNLSLINTDQILIIPDKNPSNLNTEIVSFQKLVNNKPSNAPKINDSPIISQNNNTFESQTENKSAESGEVLLIPWSEVKKLLKPKMKYKIIDVDTNLMFEVTHRFGTLHSDVEPSTSEDTKILKTIYGEWSWERRAVVAVINGKNIAASMNGMPHGTHTITDNDFLGMICVHFLGSAVHKSGKVDSKHQSMVKKAAGYKFPQNE